MACLEVVLDLPPASYPYTASELEIQAVYYSGLRPTTQRLLPSHGRMSTGEVSAALGQYENRAKTLLTRLGQLAEHLRQILANPLHAHPDWPTIVTHFRVTETQLEQLHRDVQPLLQYFVLRPASHPSRPPPPHADIPLMLSTRSYLEMEGEEAQLQATYWDRIQTQAHVKEEDEEDSEGGLEGLIERVNEAVERVGIVCDWRLAEFKERMNAYKSPGLKVPAWRKDAAARAEEAFAWCEARTDGRVVRPLPAAAPRR